jgi:serine/threonine protein kinase/class 3 adenylate cyclase/type II secretory pathway pseudopilin PulG
MAELKTFLFTDIVGSVELKHQMPGQSDTERDQAFIELVLRPHRARIERELAALGGRVVSTAGDGHFLVFSDTVSAARWAIGIQRSHRDEPIMTPQGQAVAVRISMHLGIPQVDPHDPENFVGKPVDYAARLSDYATSGQILASRSVVAVLDDAGMDGVSFHKHGRRELKGIGRVEVFELVYDRQGPRPMRAEPRESLSRQWTVLPATMGLTEFGAAGGREQGSGSRGLSAPHAVSGKPTTDVVPWRLGNYELEQRLGSGGMGDVYKARHAQFGRIRAVKVIKQHFVDTGHHEVIRRFYQEIKAVGSMEHPNIVVAIDSSAPTDAVHYLVMEYIEGIGADELVARHGPLPVAEACEIARQAARGLAYIHQHGMVHRDIKPSNLMVTLVPADELGRESPSPSPQPPFASLPQQAVVKILDLGLALLVGDDQQRLTLFDNRPMGTAMYMSPEQWKTTSVDIRADIYSLGCTLYHLLAGKPPFWESDLKPEKAHEREKLPPIPAGQAVPRPLWDVLQRMTAKNPQHRFANPAEVAAALAPFAEGHRLAELVAAASGAAQRLATQGFSKSDTLVAKSAQSDTRVGRTPVSWSLPKTLPPASRRKLWRAFTATLMLAAVAAIGWLAIQATGRRESAQQALAARRSALEVAALAANREILKEINLRFDILRRLAVDDTLRQRMAQINRSPGNESLWNPLEDWLGARRADHDRDAPADSWFINDVRGVQVARSPRSEASRGENYSHRDYFHGQGADSPEGTRGLKPIESPHLSAVYRSTSTGHLKVAFSVPVEYRPSGGRREVVGVLAMAVDLGEFDVLKRELPAGHEVVLIDLRESVIDGQRRRGLILHHQTETSYREGQPPPWIGSGLLARIDELLESTGSGEGAILSSYRDEALTGSKLYWGAMKPVIDRRPDEPPYDLRWLVLVQEPLGRT